MVAKPEILAIAACVLTSHVYTSDERVDTILVRSDDDDMTVDTLDIVELCESALAADYTRVRRAGNRLAKALAPDNPEAAKSIQRALKRQGVPLQSSGYVEQFPRDSGSRLPLVQEENWPTNPLFLNSDAGRVVSRFLEDSSHIELLAERGVSTRLGLLVHGAPGTGKTHLAGHIAAQMQVPLLVARLDSLISSRLGDTAKNIRNVFDFIPQRRAVLFLDEIDAFAKVRDDKNDLGELKRVVNTVLQGLDSLADEVVVVAATNHAHLLDPAIWRRFPYKVDLQLPDSNVRASMWAYYLFRDAPDKVMDAEVLAKVSEGLSGADIENIALAARRRGVIDGEEPSLASVAFAAARSSQAVPDLLEKVCLSHDDRRTLATVLRDKASLEVTNIARVIGVSRQMAHRYLKEPIDGE